MNSEQIRKQFLSNVKNPIQSNEDILNLVNEYYSIRGKNVNLYDKLMYCESESSSDPKDTKRIKTATNDTLLNVYNTWKNNVKSLDVTSTNINKYSPAEKETIDMYPKLKSGKRFKQTLDIKDPEVEKIFPAKSQGKLFYQIFGDRILGNKYITTPIDLRFYISSSKKNTAKIVDKIIDKSLDKKLPFLLKFAHNSDRADQIVIYSSYKDASKYREIIKQVKTDNPELFENYKKPNPLWGKIDNFIGFGEHVNEKGNSYSWSRALMLENTINHTTDYLISKALKDKRDVKFSETKRPFEDILKDLVKNEVTNNYLKFLNPNSTIPNTPGFKARVEATTNAVIAKYKSETFLTDPNRTVGGMDGKLFSFNSKEFNQKLVGILYNNIYKHEACNIFKAYMKSISNAFGIYPNNMVFNKDIEKVITKDIKKTIANKKKGHSPKKRLQRTSSEPSLKSSFSSKRNSISRSISL
jgi:hypothetical protein